MIKHRPLLAATALLTSALAISGCAAVLTIHAVGNATVPQPAKPVELGRYRGRWYELARYEQGFKRIATG